MSDSTAQDLMYRPMQVVHDFNFTPMNVQPPEGWPSDADESGKRAFISERLKRLKALGFGGVVMNTAFDDYMEDETAWERFVFSFDEALRMGLRIWIYDEQYYPSGRAGGLVMRGHPEYEAQALSCVARTVTAPEVCVRIQSPYGHGSLKYAFEVPVSPDGTPDFALTRDVSHLRTAGGGLAWDAPDGKTYRLYAFFPRTQYEGSYVCHGLRAASRQPCAMNTEATERFLGLTLDEYRRRLGAERFSHIEAFFTDEPALTGFSGWPKDRKAGTTTLPSVSKLEPADLDITIYPFLPWSDGMEKLFANEGCPELVRRLPELFEGVSDGADMLRCRFWECVAAGVDSGWSLPYREHAERLGVKYTGHFRSVRRFEEHSIICGDLLRGLGRMDMPGTDNLDSDPESCRFRHNSKLASSAAHLYGGSGVMNEISHMYNPKTPLTLELMLCTAAAQYAKGVTAFASYYGEHVLTDGEYRIYTDFTGRLGARLAEGTHRAQALLYVPYEQFRRVTPVQNSPAPDGRAARLSESVWRLEELLCSRQIDFDLVNESCLAAGRVGAGGITLENGETYQMLIFPEVSFVAEKTAEKVREALSVELSVGFSGEERTVGGLDALPEAVFWEREPEKLVSRDFYAELPCPSLTVLHKSRSDGEDYLIVNTAGSQVSSRVSVPAFAGAHLSCWDPRNDRNKAPDFATADGRIYWELSLPPYGVVIAKLVKAGG